jgi:two-component system sensor histidine kinase VanS
VEAAHIPVDETPENPRYVEVTPARDGLEEVAAIVHDMKQPLATIAISAELLGPELQGKDSAYLINMIQRQVRRLEQMVHDFAELSRTPHSDLELFRETVDLTQFIRELAAEFAPLVASHKVRLDLSPVRVMASVDIEKVRRIFENLLRNALQYSPNGTTITISLAADATVGRAVLCVEDEGPGVPNSASEEIFKPFVRLQESGSGEGLGLYVVRRFAAAHGGGAWVEDGSAGARFCIALPTLALDPNQQEQSSPEHPRRARRQRSTSTEVRTTLPNDV